MELGLPFGGRNVAANHFYLLYLFVCHMVALFECRAPFIIYYYLLYVKYFMQASYDA